MDYMLPLYAILGMLRGKSVALASESYPVGKLNTVNGAPGAICGSKFNSAALESDITG